MNGSGPEREAQAERDRIAREARAEQDRQAREAENVKVAARMREQISRFASSLDTAPSLGGLDFDGRNAGNSPSGGNSSGLDFTSSVSTPSQARPASALNFGDPMVVDAPNVPSGLPKPVENAIAAAYQNAPAGVSDRVRKGFQAVMDRDWKVAKAWFEDALNRDPGNAGLKRLVALAGTTPEGNRQAAPLTAEQRGSLQLPNADADLRVLFPGLQAMDEAEAMDILFGLPPRR